MLPVIVGLGVAAAGGASMLCSINESRESQKNLFRAISSTLSGMTEDKHYVTKVPGSGYRFWPKGTIDGISYDGTMATTIYEDSKNHTFKVVEHMYYKTKDEGKPSWKSPEPSGTVLTPGDLLKQTKGFMGVPKSVKDGKLAQQVQKELKDKHIICGVATQPNKGAHARQNPSK